MHGLRYQYGNSALVYGLLYFQLYNRQLNADLFS